MLKRTPGSRSSAISLSRLALLMASLGAAVLVFAFMSVLPLSGHTRGGAPQSQPARDTRAARNSDTGTASISGCVLSTDTGRPIRRARVVASGAGLQMPSMAFTDDSGRYEITALPPGALVVTASKGGFISFSYGQRSVPGSGALLRISGGERIERVDIRLPRGGVITGQVFDEGGEPLVGATVRATRVLWINGEQRAGVGGADTTDDRGQYRVFGLSAGRYLVSATARNDAALIAPGRSASQEAESPVAGYAPTYHPAGSGPAEATPVKIGPGQETGGIDISVRPVRLAEISGVITGRETSTAASVMLVSADPGIVLASGLSSPVTRDGAFRIRAVPPGRYLAVARGNHPGGRGAIRLAAASRFAVQEVVVAGDNITGMSLVLRAGATIVGRIAFEGDNGGSPADFSSVRIVAAPASASIGLGSTVLSVRFDGTFVLDGLAPLSVVLDAVVPAGGPSGTEQRRWWLKGIYLDGRDIAGRPMVLHPDQRITGVVALFSGSATALSGNVRTDGGQAAPGCSVVVFPADSSLWRLPRSRYLRMVRTDRHGHFEFRGLPAGRYYIHAVADADSAEWSSPENLEKLSETASPTTLVERETKFVDLLLKRQ